MKCSFSVSNSFFRGLAGRVGWKRQTECHRHVPRNTIPVGITERIRRFATSFSSLDPEQTPSGCDDHFPDIAERRI